MSKRILIIIAVVTLLVLAAYYFTSTESGMKNRIRLKYGTKGDAEYRFKLNQEMEGKSLEDLKYLLAYGELPPQNA